MSSLIQRRVEYLQQKKINLGAEITKEMDAGYGGRMQEFEKATLYSHKVMGGFAWEIYGDLRDKYISLGGHGKHPATGERLFGFPLYCNSNTLEAGIPYCAFEWGGIYFNRGCHYLHGRIFEYYKAIDHDRSWLGLPIADPKITGSDERQLFEFGELWLDKSASKKIIELKWTIPQLGRPSMIKNTELANIYMLSVTSHEMDVSSYTAKILINGFKGKLFLKETGGNKEIPVELDGTKIKTNEFTNPINQEKRKVHQFPFKMSDSSILKDDTLYDIIVKLPDNKTHTLSPHSVYIKNNWDTCNIAHITDLHLSRRYDSYRKKLTEKGFDKGAKEFNNFNDALRQFILYANKLHGEGKLDFILCTGDLVDFIFEDLNGEKAFINATNNFKFFEEIILGEAPALDQIAVAELKVPIFTSLGNHDYRVRSYGLINHVDVTGWFDFDQKQYCGANLKPVEAELFSKSIGEGRALEMITPDLENKNHCLNYYLKHINRSLSYEIMFGNNRVIMIDGKWDSDYPKDKKGAISIKAGTASNELMQFASGTPNSIGFTDNEISMVKDILKSSTGLVIIGAHQPLINPSHNVYPHHFRESLRIATPRAFDTEMTNYLKLADNYSIELEQFDLARDTPYIYNSTHKHPGWSHTMTPFFANGDGDDLLDCGIMRNKKKFLNLCAGVNVLKPVDLILSGHIHFNWECRLKYNKDTDDFNFYADFYTENPSKYYPEKDRSTGVLYEVEIGKMTEVVELDDKIKKRADGTFVLKTIPNPETLNLARKTSKKNWWKKHAPLFIQTDALGPLNYQRQEGEVVPRCPDFRGCRLISISESTIDEIHYVTKHDITNFLD
jgi:hypothetical protein